MSLNIWVFQLNPDTVHDDGEKYNIHNFQDAISEGFQEWGPHGGAYYKRVGFGDIVLIKHIKNSKTDKYDKWADKIVGFGKITKTPSNIKENFLITLDKDLSSKLIANPLPCDKIKDFFLPNITWNKTIIPLLENANYDIIIDIINQHLIQK